MNPELARLVHQAEQPFVVWLNNRQVVDMLAFSKREPEKFRWWISVQRLARKEARGA